MCARTCACAHINNYHYWYRWRISAYVSHFLSVEEVLGCTQVTHWNQGDLNSPYVTELCWLHKIKPRRMILVHDAYSLTTVGLDAHCMKERIFHFCFPSTNKWAIRIATVTDADTQGFILLHVGLKANNSFKLFVKQDPERQKCFYLSCLSCWHWDKDFKEENVLLEVEKKTDMPVSSYLFASKNNSWLCNYWELTPKPRSKKVVFQTPKWMFEKVWTFDQCIWLPIWFPPPRLCSLLSLFLFEWHLP